MTYQTIETPNAKPIKAWVDGVPFEEGAKAQARYIAMLPCLGSHIVLCPDTHAGRPTPIGAVVPMVKAISPGLVSGDIGCGVSWVRTSLTSKDISDNAKEISDAIYGFVPTMSWEDGNFAKVKTPASVIDTWNEMKDAYRALIDKHGRISSRTAHIQLGTLGRSNHFISINIDEEDRISILLHSGSRNLGARMAEHFVPLAIKDYEAGNTPLPNRELSFFTEGSEHFNDYVEAMLFAQEYARLNRVVMMENIIRALKREVKLNFEVDQASAINVHHNYARRENHFGEEVWITRKGAISAFRDEMGVVPGNMGGRSFIVRGKGNADSLMSSSHGAGRALSRTIAKQTISKEQHKRDMGACYGRLDTIDESKAAYKDVDAVMKAQEDLTEVVHTLQEMISIKG